MYYIGCPKNGTDEPVRVPLGQPLDYADMTDYIKAWPDKLVNPTGFSALPPPGPAMPVVLIP